MNIVLTGFMGAGKTTIARRVAQRLGYDYLDTDRQIELEQGCSVADIFGYSGETCFRELETKLLKRLIDKENTVIATGGGILTTPGNMELLKQIGITVYLQVDLDIIFERVSRNKNRPLLRTENPRQTLEDLFQQRKHLYEAADITVKSNNLSANSVAGQVIRAI